MMDQDQKTYCTKCNAEIGENERFCKNCGNLCSLTDENENTQDSNSEGMSDYQFTQPNAFGKKRVVIILSIVIVLALVATLLFTPVGKYVVGNTFYSLKNYTMASKYLTGIDIWGSKEKTTISNLHILYDKLSLIGEQKEQDEDLFGLTEFGSIWAENGNICIKEHTDFGTLDITLSCDLVLKINIDTGEATYTYNHGTRGSFSFASTCEGNVSIGDFKKNGAVYTPEKCDVALIHKREDVLMIMNSLFNMLASRTNKLLDKTETGFNAGNIGMYQIED